MMFFVASKLFWMVAAPVTLLLMATAAGAALLVAGVLRAGRTLVLVGTGLLLLTGVLPVGALVLRPLEDRFPPLPDALMAPTGIIVLGGSTDQDLALARHRVTIVDSADRMTEAVVLARRFPAARVVFTGGTTAIAGSDDTEAADARRLWTAMGIADDRITTEDRSRNTDENVRFAKAIVHPAPGETWVLVTSAFHMPRAVALFRTHGWPVVADPVDYRTRGDASDLAPSLDIPGNWSRLTLVREWIGLVVYRLSGRTADLLPVP